MDTNKRKKVETAGWKIGDANNFLNLTEAETKLVEIKLRLALPTKKKKKKP